MTVITRFAPSPTGMLHIGNARTAIANWLYARKYGGQFILRIDDTDLERSKKEYEEAIVSDLKWLGMNWDETFSQSSRMEKYEAVKRHLIETGRLYECYETPEELEVKRKLQLSAHMPPIYDRSSLRLTQDQKDKFQNQGRKPHYRFLMNDSTIEWNDMVKGTMKYESHNIGDPILVREDGTMTYMICSCVDDVDYNISHILRGEDHLTNTAIQIQILEALGAKLPSFGHLSLVNQREGKISKRIGGFEISSLRDAGIEAMTINSFFSTIGTSDPVKLFANMKQLAEHFDITKFSKSPTTYLPEELERLNHKFIMELDYKDVENRLPDITEDFWLAVRANIKSVLEAKEWWNICSDAPRVPGLDSEYLKAAASLFPEGEITENTWQEWTKRVSAETGKMGKDLFMPLRLALTGVESGPELKTILPMIGREKILQRLG
ncbi:MAG: glutamate--tRNA ligase [Rickettsiaceae bacterium]|nr:glutamate--tRNA ligase [Rickettsiaceae bacterium]